MPEAAQSAAFADDQGVDADFVHRLVRGSELLSGGDASGARALLEQALRLQPGNERGQNLLALSYFKLGMFQRAEELYRALIVDHPDDATLRMNLGLVFLKAGRSDDAIRSFEAALGVEPGHRKTANYLGLMHFQRKDWGRAKEYFDLAQNAQMSARAAVALANAAAPQPGDAPGPVTDGVEMTFSPSTEVARERTGPWLVARGENPPPPDASPELVSFTSTARLEGPPAAPFAVTPTLVVIDVKTELYVRLEDLLATFGNVDFKPAFKRFRGRVTDKPFGEPERRMMHATGPGRVWVQPGARRFLTLEIGDEAAFFREDLVFAFEESLLFENGRVPSKVGGDLQLVHLRGRGKVLVSTAFRPRAVEVTREEPCRVPVDRLVGWHGNVAPRVVALGEDGTETNAVATVELSGEGRVILDALPLT